MLHWSCEILCGKFICGQIKFVKHNDGQKFFGEIIYGEVIIIFIPLEAYKDALYPLQTMHNFTFYATHESDVTLYPLVNIK